MIPVLERVLVILLSVSLVSAGLPGRAARAVAAPANGGAQDGDADAPARGDHFLRDAIPAASFAAQPADTVVDEDFFLPEETDKKKLYRDIAVFIVASAMIAFFIIKVFIEEDPEPDTGDDGGKDIPPPR